MSCHRAHGCLGCRLLTMSRGEQVTRNLPWFEEALPGSFVKMRRRILGKVELEYVKVMTVEEVEIVERAQNRMCAPK